MATRVDRLAELETDAKPAPDASVEVLCEDHVGTYRLPYLCRLTPDGLRADRGPGRRLA